MCVSQKYDRYVFSVMFENGIVLTDRVCVLSQVTLKFSMEKFLMFKRKWNMCFSTFILWRKNSVVKLCTFNIKPNNCRRCIDRLSTSKYITNVRDCDIIWLVLVSIVLDSVNVISRGDKSTYISTWNALSVIMDTTLRSIVVLLAIINN